MHSVNSLGWLQSGSIIRDTAKEAAQAAPVVVATASKARSVATNAIAAAADKRKNPQKASTQLGDEVCTRETTSEYISLPKSV